MATVSSLDKDLSRLRLGKYTPQASAEIKDWIIAMLNEDVGNGDLMAVLKDGTVLCRLANLLGENPQIRFKNSAMPFVQMENISHFLSFVARSPVLLPPHDLFLTVDLYEQKDPAQVCQCITSYSRIAHKLNPGAFPTTIGGLKVAAQLSPQLSGGVSGFLAGGARKVSGGSAGSGGWSSVISGCSGSCSTAKPAIPPRKAAVSTWSKSSDETATLPAWNIAQYGYLGGASQGNQGISFGARRQITNSPVVKSAPAATLTTTSTITTSPPPPVLSFAEKYRREEAAKKREAEVEEEQKRVSQAAEERRRAVEEADRWRREEEEKTAMELEHKKWKEEQERRKLWQYEQDRQQELERHKEEFAFERREEETRRARDREAQFRLDREKKERERERERIRELERELEKARERERIYEAEKEERRRQDTERMRRDAQEIAIRRHRTGESPSTPSITPFTRSHQTGDHHDSEKIFPSWRNNNDTPPPQTPPRHHSRSPPVPRALPTPPPRKLPATPTNPNTYYSTPMQLSRSWETNDDVSTEREREESEKQAAYKWASMSLLERERESERQRQKEWELAQQETQLRSPHPSEQVGWDLNQYGYLGGAHQGLMDVSFGRRRQIVGPRGGRVP